MPVKHLTLRQVFCLAKEIRVGFIEVDQDNTIAAVGTDHRVAYDGVARVSHTFVGGLTAESNRAIGALNRLNGQVQGVDTVLSVAGLVFCFVLVFLTNVLVA